MQVTICTKFLKVFSDAYPSFLHRKSIALALIFPKPDPPFRLVIPAVDAHLPPPRERAADARGGGGWGAWTSPQVEFEELLATRTACFRAIAVMRAMARLDPLLDASGARALFRNIEVGTVVMMDGWSCWLLCQREDTPCSRIKIITMIIIPTQITFFPSLPRLLFNASPLE